MAVHNTNCRTELRRCMESHAQVQSFWEQKFHEQSIQAQNNQKILQELIFRIFKQLEDQHQVITSMSKDINDLQTRQIQSETRKEESKLSSLSKRIQKRRDLECRTIIPWDEVDLDMYSEL